MIGLVLLIRHLSSCFGVSVFSGCTLLCVTSYAAGPQDNCLDTVYQYYGSTPSEAEHQFNLQFDRNLRGRSFSCQIIASASDARRTLEDFRTGFLYDSNEHFERSVRLPLTISVYRTLGVEKPKHVTVRNFKDWLNAKKELFDPVATALVSCANLRNVRIYKNRGFAIGHGFIWFTGDDVKVGAINLRPRPKEQLLTNCLVNPVASLPEIGESTALFLESPQNTSLTVPPTRKLSGLTYDERSSIKSVCASEKLFQGPAAYNRCVESQLRDLN